MKKGDKVEVITGDEYVFSKTGSKGIIIDFCKSTRPKKEDIAMVKFMELAIPYYDYNYITKKYEKINNPIWPIFLCHLKKIK